jgi:hypothetical protein
MVSASSLTPAATAALEGNEVFFIPFDVTSRFCMLLPFFGVVFSTGASSSE